MLWSTERGEEMTHAQAKSELMQIYMSLSEEKKQALDMAIKALEQEPCEDCRNCKKWDDCECGRKGHINGTSIGYSIGECKDYEPSGDAISRQDAYKCLEIHGDYDTLNEVYERLQKLPSVKQEPKTGHWIWQTEDIYRCSECGEDIHVKEVMNKPQYAWCPICGCPMGVEHE